MNLDSFMNVPRILIDARLKPIQGTRFQPTGFPDLGAAEYQAPDGVAMLLVESPQSMANHLESACWNEAEGRLIDPLEGLPFVEAKVKETTTNSILEAHRLNSPYIVKSKTFKEEIEPEIGFEKNKPFDRFKLAHALAKYDVNSLLHGVFLEKVGGTVRLPRCLSAFIEASDVKPAHYGGVKIDRVQPATGGDNPAYGKAKDGFGNVPYHRADYTGNITAYFNVDVSQIRGYGLGNAMEELLVGLALFKIQAVLREGLRLRTACDLDVEELSVRRPKEASLPSYDELVDAMPGLIERAKGNFAQPPKTVVEYGTK